MDSGKALHQYLRGKLRFIGVVALVLVASLIALVIYRESQLLSIEQETAPALNQAQQSLVLQLQVNRLLNELAQSVSIEELADRQRAYSEKLIVLTTQQVFSPLLTKKLQKENNEFTSEIARLALEAEKAEQLKRSSIIQLRLLVDELSGLLAGKRIEKNELFLQITQDNVNDKVTASRAKAFAVISQQLALYEDTYHKIVKTVSGFEQLDLHLSLAVFDDITGQLKFTLNNWQTQFNSVSQYSGVDQRVIYLLIQLKDLMFDQQRTVAKWRSQLRIAQSYFVVVRQHQQHFSSRLSTFELPEIAPISIVPGQIQEATTSYFLITQNIYYGALLSVFFAGLCLVWWMLYRIFHQLVEFKRDLSVVVSSAQQVSNAELPDVSSTDAKELALVKQTLREIARPEHGEAEYEELFKASTLHEQLLFEHLQTGFWSINEHGQITGDFAIMLCSEKASENILSWRHLFDGPSVHRLLTAAKLAKATKRVQHCTVVTQEQQHAQVSIHFDETRWHGSISLTELIFEKEQTIGKLERALAAGVSEKHQLAMESASQLSRMVIQTMLQSQNVSLGSNVSSLQVYRQLSRILDWCRQIQISNALQSTEHTLQRSNAEIRNELNAALFNIAAEGNLQRNSVFLQVASNVMQQGQLNIRLFHRCMKGLAKILLTELFNSQLLITVTVQDQDEGKQVLNIDFDVLTDRKYQELPDAIQQLLDFSFEGHDYSPQLVRYLHLLMRANHCEELNALITETGVKLNLRMPIAFSSTEGAHKAVSNDSINFSSKKALIVSSCSYICEAASKALAVAKTHFEILNDVNYFAQQLSVKHLTQHQVSVVLLGPELLKDNIDGIKQHLASLPSKLRPQLFVMQSPFNQLFHRVGFYQFASTPFDQTLLLENVNDLFESGAQSNEIIPAEQFGKLRFNPTQVEVLLAVNDPMSHQVLYRLLAWLGLQVQFVCQSSDMLKHWQSGRFMILISEFEQSPFIEMDVGHKVSRAVFTFTEQLFDQGTHGGNWHVDVLPSVSELEALIEILSPWLNDATLRPAVPISKMPATTPAVENATLSTEQRGLEESFESLEMFNVESHELSNEIPLAFDMVGYANNQGSAELAGLMLEEYITQVSLCGSQFEQALSTENDEEMVAVISDALALGKILMASELNTVCQNILHAISDQDYALLKALKKELAQAVEKLTLSAEVI